MAHIPGRPRIASIIYAIYTQSAFYWVGFVGMQNILHTYVHSSAYDPHRCTCIHRLNIMSAIRYRMYIQDALAHSSFRQSHAVTKPSMPHWPQRAPSTTSCRKVIVVFVVVGVTNPSSSGWLLGARAPLRVNLNTFPNAGYFGESASFGAYAFVRMSCKHVGLGQWYMLCCHFPGAMPDVRRIV